MFASEHSTLVAFVFSLALQRHFFVSCQSGDGYKYYDSYFGHDENYFNYEDYYYNALYLNEVYGKG